MKRTLCACLLAALAVPALAASDYAIVVSEKTGAGKGHRALHGSGP